MPWAFPQRASSVSSHQPPFSLSLAPHERLPEILVVPREKTPTGVASAVPTGSSLSDQAEGAAPGFPSPVENPQWCEPCM